MTPGNSTHVLQTYLAVMLGGAAGTGLRMWLSTALTLRYGDMFPIGTLVVNVTGCFVIGFFGSMTGPQGALAASPMIRSIIMTGVLGGFTTFSAFSLQTLTLMNEGAWARAVLNVVLSLSLCLVGVWLGHLVAAAWSR